MNKRLCLFALCLSLTVFLYAQKTADEIEALLGTKAVTYAQAARFVLEASDVTIMADPAEAFQYAAERSWLPKKAAADQAARFDGIALLIMRSFDIKGGIWYSFAKSPHTAYRELAYLDIIQGRIDPSMAVSGDNLLYIVNRVLFLREEAERKRPMSAHEKLAAVINTQIEENHIANVRASVTKEGVTINISNIQFLPDSDVLTEAEKMRIREIAQILAVIPGRRILIAGHTALAGGDIDRFAMSLERARSVAVYLVSLGARRPGDITTVGYGADRPVADNSTPEGMAANRRVEITILDN
ncbi:MAG: OmpA family protein [Treponema sp.]|jgi:outer membrane protein OmpA-like peptidoglycan-associated protein|nr:OmpA family protein [Treponema sp.]